MSGKTNLAASVAARLLNQAKQTGDDYLTLLTSYCLERFLYRLGVSDRRDRFVLKGAMLLRLWSERPYRATRDLDLLRLGDGAFDAIRDDLRAIVTTPAPPDAVDFDGEHIRIDAIRAEDEYAGTRATLSARCGSARLVLHVDMGFGDAVWPAAQACVYPALLDFPAPQLLAYPREAVVAEKLDAMVVLGDRNSGSRTSSTCTTSPAASSSIARRWPRQCGAPSRAAVRRFRRTRPSRSRASIGRTPRGRRRCARSRGAPELLCLTILRTSARGCSMRSSRPSSRTSGAAVSRWARGRPKGRGVE